MTQAIKADAKTVFTRMGDLAAEVEVFEGCVRDQIILIREAVASMRENDLSDISLDLKREKWSMTVTARRKS